MYLNSGFFDCLGLGFLSFDAPTFGVEVAVVVGFGVLTWGRESGSEASLAVASCSSDSSVFAVVAASPDRLLWLFASQSWLERSVNRLLSSMQRPKGLSSLLELSCLLTMFLSTQSRKLGSDPDTLKPRGLIPSGEGGEFVDMSCGSKLFLLDPLLFLTCRRGYIQRNPQFKKNVF